jgi:primosomal protein N' (replication factor Y) (superfamily II helicase)
MNHTLFIFPKRGLYTLTKCTSCGYGFQCEHCDANLVTYRKWANNLELVCHQCQSYYNYPLKCPKCESVEISSYFGGVDELVEIIEKESGTTVTRYDDKKRNKEVGFATNAVTTRIFDPSIPYSSFTHIVFVEAQNLLASPDYLVQEEIHKQILELMLSISDKSEIIFDTNSPDLELFTTLARLDIQHSEHLDKKEWFVKFLDKEGKNRDVFGFPPFVNTLLLTTQQKNKEKSLEIINHVRTELVKLKPILPDLTISSAYQARFLKRKGMFSYHVLVRFPRQYKDIGKLREEIMQLGSIYGVQIRLNPRHLF